eukprot:SAG25_NODE_233_length_11359_cov_14.674600_1_plen_65_part_00
MSAALTAELGALKMGALSRRAVAAGVDEDALEAAQDEGDKVALTPPYLTIYSRYLTGGWVPRDP